MAVDEAVSQLYGNRTRVRACGLCFRESEILLVSHRGIHADRFWAPPGGGVDFGTDAQGTLVREFAEETGLVVRPGAFLFVCEYLRPPLHGVELFFETEVMGGQLIRGTDPEMGDRPQLIDDVRYWSADALSSLPREQLHGIFGVESDPLKIRNLRGYYRLR